MSMVKAQEKQSYQLHSKTLYSLGIDYLKQFPELDEYRVEAGMGILYSTPATQKKTSKGKYVFTIRQHNKVKCWRGLID